MTIDHRVASCTAPHGGCTIAIDLRAPAALELVLRVTYGPIVQRLVNNLARVAAENSSPTRSTKG